MLDHYGIIQAGNLSAVFCGGLFLFAQDVLYDKPGSAEEMISCGFAG